MVPRILVVAADRALAEYIAAVLESEGYAVLRADDGDATLAALRREGYDVLITDDLFPRIGDALLIPYLRDYPGLALPIVLVAPPRLIPMPPNTTLLATPFTADGLSALVAALLEKARARYWD